MTVELEPAPGMAGLEELGQGLERACRDLELARPLAQWVVAAGLGAWSAVALAGGERARVRLDKGLSQVSLSLGYALPPQAGDETPPGLAAGLFSPPALRVTQGRESERLFWQAVWEV